MSLISCLDFNPLSLFADNPNFKLGGSRFFAAKFPDIIQLDENKNTDWDFYCSDTTENHLLLEKLGFLQITCNPCYPFDDLTICLYIKNNCQVIVKRDFELYSRVMESITPEFYRDFLWKSGPNFPSKSQIMSIFNQLYKTATK